LAKIANKIVKKFPEATGNCYIIDSEHKKNKALKWTKTKDIWGIGEQLSNKLEKLNIKTAYDFCRLNEQWVKNEMSIVGVRLKRDLSGIPSIAREDIKKKKNIATTRSFEKHYLHLHELNERISSFAVSCAEKLRKQQSVCQAMLVFIHTDGFKPELPQYSKNILFQLPFPSNSAIELSKFASEALKKIYRPGFAYKKAGVMVMELSPKQNQQMNLFENSNPKHHSLMKAFDQINAHFGQQKIRLASQSMGKVWKMKQAHLSPSYSTKLSDIITINCPCVSTPNKPKKP
jgi:DNA polymerase V